VGTQHSLPCNPEMKRVDDNPFADFGPCRRLRRIGVIWAPPLATMRVINSLLKAQTLLAGPECSSRSLVSPRRLPAA
jgi:hypothetical protein